MQSLDCALQEPRLHQHEQGFMQNLRSIRLPAPLTTIILREVLHELEDEGRHALQTTLDCYKQNRMSDEDLVSFVKSLTHCSMTLKMVFEREDAGPAEVNMVDNVDMVDQDSLRGQVTVSGQPSVSGIPAVLHVSKVLTVFGGADWDRQLLEMPLHHIQVELVPGHDNKFHLTMPNRAVDGIFAAVTNRAARDRWLFALSAMQVKVKDWHPAPDMASSIRTDQKALKNMELRRPERRSISPPDASGLPWRLDSVETDVPRSRDSSRTGSPSKGHVQAGSQTLMRELEASMAELKEQIALIERFSRLKDLEKVVAVKLQESSSSLKRSESEPLHAA